MWWHSWITAAWRTDTSWLLYIFFKKQLIRFLRPSVSVWKNASITGTKQLIVVILDVYTWPCYVFLLETSRFAPLLIHTNISYHKQYFFFLLSLAVSNINKPWGILFVDFYGTLIHIPVQIMVGVILTQTVNVSYVLNKDF